MVERSERRSLVEGLAATPTTTSREREFVYADKAASATIALRPAPAAKPFARSPFTTRIRDDYAKALKRASLERQLDGVAPSTLQDILEEALEPWLKSNGYLAE